MKKLTKQKNKESVFEFKIQKKEFTTKELTLSEAQERITEIERKISDNLSNIENIKFSNESLELELEALSVINK